LKIILVESTSMILAATKPRKLLLYFNSHSLEFYYFITHHDLIWISFTYVYIKQCTYEKLFDRIFIPNIFIIDWLKINEHYIQQSRDSDQWLGHRERSGLLDLPQLMGHLLGGTRLLPHCAWRPMVSRYCLLVRILKVYACIYIRYYIIYEIYRSMNIFYDFICVSIYLGLCQMSQIFKSWVNFVSFPLVLY
jgi:hypothetical protein